MEEKSVAEVLQKQEKEKAIHTLTTRNSECLLVSGSSLTQGVAMPYGYGWLDKLNDILDFPIINGGHGGANIMQNVAELGNGAALFIDSQVIPRHLNIAYILFHNSANGTVGNGENGYKILTEAKYVADTYGAKMLVGCEEPWTVDGKTYFAWAKQNNIPYFNAREIIQRCYPTNYYEGCIWRDHRGWRAIAPYLNYGDFFKVLPIKKSIKMYKVRPQVVVSDVSDLAYDNNKERLQLFHALNAGVLSSVENNLDFNGADNLNIEQYDITGGEIEPVNGSLIGKMLMGQSITFTDYALIELILDVVSLDMFSFTFICSVQPTHIYIANNKTSDYSSSSPTQHNSIWTQVPFVYEDNAVKIDIDDCSDLLSYDKVRILVEREGIFGISNPIAKYDGIEKTITYTEYEHRKTGVEARQHTSIDAADWTLNGASIVSFPQGCEQITAYNNVNSILKLSSNNDTATTVVNNVASKVAIRIVAQNFYKYMTTRFSGSDYNDYVADTPQVGEYQYDYGKLIMVINNTYVKEFDVPCGWNELYCELDTQNETNLSIVLKRANLDSVNTPILIHDVSVQKIQ
jgi:hypothetical protein